MNEMQEEFEATEVYQAIRKEHNSLKLCKLVKFNIFAQYENDQPHLLIGPMIQTRLCNA